MQLQTAPAGNTAPPRVTALTEHCRGREKGGACWLTSLRWAVGGGDVRACEGSRVRSWQKKRLWGVVRAGTLPSVSGRMVYGSGWTVDRGASWESD